MRGIGLLTGIGVERQRGVGSASRSIVFIEDWLPKCPHFGSASGPGMRSVIDFFYFKRFFGKFFFEAQSRKAYTTLRSAALKVVASNWKSLYNTQISCF